MKKHYIIFFLAMLPLIALSQTINTVQDNLGVVFNAEYTTRATPTGVTLTVSITENAGALSDIAEVYIYRSYGDNRVNGRTRIAKVITTGFTGTVVFQDDSQVWTEDTNSSTGYTGDGAFEVGVPTSYSIKVIMNDGTDFNSSRAIPTVYIENETSPTRVVQDVINDDMSLLTRVYENEANETALLVIGLAPSTNYPTDPYQLFVDAIKAKTGDDTINWASYPCFISEVLYNEVSALAGRAKDTPGSRVFWSNKGVVYHLVKKGDIKPDDIDATGMTHVSFKIGRPNSSQPANGFDYNSLVSVPIQITSATAGVNDEFLSDLSVYPNPSNGTVYIKGDKLIEEIKVFNIIGKSIFAQKNINNTSTVVDFKNKTSGIYFAKIKTEVGTTTRKIIIK
ncbi:hypothetical protein BW723_07080 [Polaribacter reichenbachii]|uniref:Secretion system C-terminal sorting domain-containing protein n=1 Tax=Polaribacter reichenbachii TaxID=996801 RepID=A0A1B8U6N5_9FLAO|nr:T9SS type A sorting domain-containing protein [Polaribacter reichenbachii]APZ46073.1 hypothetical protein BW723_07080 [Polaribacter reichenbachii]AUC19935.1 hypothetical protein BTO17_15100 [Polaribacter reichenbachii]OBY67521.1 hypothetical protein LPB301_02410 [Polaribacter reichenbachii]